MFHRDYPYTSDIYARLFGEAAFKKLENRMLSQGYKRFDIFDVTASDCKLSLTIANPKWSDSPPNGGFEYKIKHTGISARLDPYVQNPTVFGLCIPKGLMTSLIKSFDLMDEQLKDFFIKRTTKCWNCNYCVQTDKTGSRPKAYIPVRYEDNEHRLCTYFPGYNYCWTYIDDNLSDDLIKMLSFMDQLAPSK